MSTIREIILDTETTGIDWNDGHRIIEIGAVELINRMPTGKVFHQYINPERLIEQEAINVHGITDERVANEPLFKEIADAFYTFLADSPIVAHNATFDMNFINMEFGRLGQDPLPNEVVDTLAMARKKFPGARCSLDALCQRFDIDLSGRTYHGALLDARLLADVYLELTGGRQPNLLAAATSSTTTTPIQNFRQTVVRPPRSFPASAEEVAAHMAFMAKIAPTNFWYPKPEEKQKTAD